MNRTLEKLYRDSVKSDFNELILEYPFSLLTFPPAASFQPAMVKTVAVHKELIEEVQGKKEDFLGNYTKELLIIVPLDYKQKGCRVYGAPWIDFTRIKEQDNHFFPEQNNRAFTEKHGHHMCVGVPASFPLMKNVLLENVRTADNMLVAYKNAMIDHSSSIELIAYAHGREGKIEFVNDKRRFVQ